MLYKVHLLRLFALQDERAHGEALPLDVAVSSVV
jgi:hypothetical protein